MSGAVDTGVDRADVLAAALDYQGGSLAPVLLEGKAPVAAGWNTAPRPTADGLRRAYRPGMNVGLRTGRLPWHDAADGALVVLDMDISSTDPRHVAEAQAELVKLVGPAAAQAPTVRTGSGMGGAHWYIRMTADQAPGWTRRVLANSTEKVSGRKPDGSPTSKAAWQLEVISTGGQVVASPSLHPVTGKPYELVGLPLMGLPDGIARAIAGLGAQTGAALARIAGGQRQHAGPLGDILAAAGAAAGGVTGDKSAFAGVETVPPVERMASALAVLDPDMGRAEWLRVVFAVAAHQHEEGEAIARDWSARSDKYDADTFGRDWASWRSGPGSVGVGTLYHLAQAAGWREGGAGVGAHNGAVIGNVSSLAAAASSNDTLEHTLERADAAAAADADADADASTSHTPRPLVLGGDIEHGRTFAAEHAGRLLFIEASRSWMAWDGSRWTQIGGPEVDRLAQQTADRVVIEANAGVVAAGFSDAAKARRRAAERLHTDGRRRQEMVTAAQAHLFIKDASAFDADPWVLNCPNGLVNLRDGSLRGARPEDRVSRQTRVPYLPGAQCPRFLQFLADVFEGRADVIDFVQRMAGYCLTGDVSEEKVFFWLGAGANGKSVLGTVLGEILGEYTAAVSSALLRRDSGSDGTQAVLRLMGARLVQMNELAEGEVWNESRLKELASREPVTARQLYGQSFEFKPTHKLVVRSNVQPVIRDGSDGTWRRMVLLRFGRKFTADEQIPDLERQLIGLEGAGILAWMVEGCLKWQAGGLQLPTSVRYETSGYRHEQDVVGQFIEEQCIVGTAAGGGREKKHAVWARWQAWAKFNGMHAGTANAFTRRMAERGVRMADDKRNMNDIQLVPLEQHLMGLGV